MRLVNLDYIDENSDIVVLWSGGLDSTYLLHHLITNENYAGNKVQAVSITPNFITSDKAKNEERCRNRYINEVASKSEIQSIGYYNIDMSNMPLIKIGANHGGVQLAFWISSIYPYLPVDCTLLVSTVKGDDQIVFFEKTKELINNLNHFYSKKVKIGFPLQLLHKEDVLTLAADLDILKYTWSCEEGTFLNNESKLMTKPCKRCQSCHTQITSLVSATSFNNTNQLLHDYALDQYNIDTTNRIEGMIDYTDERKSDMIESVDYFIEQSGIIARKKEVREIQLLTDNELVEAK